MQVNIEKAIQVYEFFLNLCYDIKENKNKVSAAVNFTIQYHTLHSSTLKTE